MSSLHECLGWALDPRRTGPPTALCFSEPEDQEAMRWQDAVIPKAWQRRHVALDDSASWASHPDPELGAMFIVAPFVRVGDAEASKLDCEEDGWRDRPVLPAALLLRAARRAQPGQQLCALMPSSAFATGYPDPRESLLDCADVRLLVESDRSWSAALGLHRSLRLILLAVRRRSSKEDHACSRFLHLPPEPDIEALRKELSALFKQQGGTTSNGYVLREPLDPRRPLQFAAHDPERKERQARLRALGEVRRLGDLVSVRMGRVHSTRDADRIGPEGVPILAGRDVALGDRGGVGEERCIKDAREEDLLRPDDICVASVSRGPSPLRVRRISSEELPLVANHSVLVLRPTVPLDDATLSFLVDYLRSPRAAALLQHELTGGPLLRPRQLAELAVPMPDETVLSALAELRDTENQLKAWIDEVQRAIGGVLDDTAADAGILTLRSTGQLLRHRVAAGRQLDDLGHRIRNLFPFPVALPWRRAVTANTDTEGYETILGCAESLAGYLAALSIVLARQLGIELGSLKSLRDKSASGGHGVSMSDWSAIVREVAGKSVANAATASTPLVELTELMGAGSEAQHALEAVTTMRNDQAHHRGPKGGQVVSAFGEALEHLVALYGECEWLVDYPVRLIEDVVWDSYSSAGRYAFRELVGDHYLVPEQIAETSFPTLDKGRLYVTDRTGALHLLSPLVHWHECDHCHVPSAFFLDSFDRKARACRMRAMDHNHAITSTEVVRPLISLGLLPSDDR